MRKGRVKRVILRPKGAGEKRTSLGKRERKLRKGQCQERRTAKEGSDVQSLDAIQGDADENDQSETMAAKC